MSGSSPRAHARHSLVPFLVAVVLGLAACGGSGDDDGKDTRAKDAAPIGTGTLARQASLLGDEGVTATAGESESYVPEGEIIADSGFRPETNGFAFENYGNDVGPENLTPAEIQSLFGDQVCLGGDGEDCTLIPPAQKWMENENERMAGGHCMGFSVAAIRMFQEALDPAQFGEGADEAADLEIVGNVDLQKSIAEHWVYQSIPLVQEAIVQGTPSEITQRLVDDLNSGEEKHTLGILMADGTGGHAVTPFAVEDRGDGTLAILVYDNNFPGITRAVEVDPEADTWRYVGGTNPKDLGQVYEGTAETQSMLLLPTSPGDQVQPCPFCREEVLEEGEGLGSVTPDAAETIELILGGDPANHPHIVISDEEGRRTGIVDGELLREVPGVEVDLGFGVQNWESSPEPRFRVPKGQDVLIQVDGTALEKATTASVNLIGGGLAIEIEDIKVARGQTDSVFLAGDGSGLLYEMGGKGESSPNLYAGLEEDGAAYTFAATAEGLRKGSIVGLVVDRETGTVLLDASDVKGALDGEALFGVVVGKATADEELLWSTDALELSGRRDDDVTFNYRDTPAAGKSLPLEVGPVDGKRKTVRAQFGA